METASVAEEAAVLGGGANKIRRRSGRGEVGKEGGERENCAIIVTC